MRRPLSRQRGSVLFVILVGVILFAALSYTVASMMRGGNPAIISEEKARIFAAEIINYGRALRQATQNLKITGCTAEEISFENTTLVGYDHTPAAAAECQIFNESGGSMVYLVPALDDWLDMNYSPTPALRGQWFFPANTCVPGIGNAPAGGCRADGQDNEALIVILPYVNRQICIQINRELGVGTPGAAPPQEIDNAWPAGSTKFTGTFANGEQIDLANTTAACFEGNGATMPPDNTYHYYQVLLPR